MSANLDQLESVLSWAYLPDLEEGGSIALAYASGLRHIQEAYQTGLRSDPTSERRSLATAFQRAVAHLNSLRATALRAEAARVAEANAARVAAIQAAAKAAAAAKADLKASWKVNALTKQEENFRAYERRSDAGIQSYRDRGRLDAATIDALRSQQADDVTAALTPVTALSAGAATYIGPAVLAAATVAAALLLVRRTN